MGKTTFKLALLMNSPVAIDLGTSFCRVAAYRPHDDGRVRIIPDFVGCTSCCYSVHSNVAFVDNARLVGLAARMEFVQNPSQTVSRIKSYLGKTYSELVDKLKNISFQVIPADDGSDCLIINDEYYPEEIAALLVNRMREIVTHTIKQSVNDIVITVPACFNDAQRQATVDSIEIAGLRVVAMLNETTAAAFVYAFMSGASPKNVLFYDLGGGHVSVAIARVSNCEVRILATAGNQNVGGNELSDRFTAYIAGKIFENYGQDATINAKTNRRLYLLCDRVKRELSCRMECDLFSRNLLPDVLVEVSNTRAEFEEVGKDLFRAAIEPIDEALGLASMSVDDIDDVVVLGGSARIPRIDFLLREKFNRRQLNKSLHSEETIVCGAALYAAQLVKMLPRTIKVFEVMSHAIGIEQSFNLVKPLIPRNTPIPCVVRRVLSTKRGGDQSHLTVHLYEGDRAKTTENNYLGSFEITELRRAFGDINEAIVDFEIEKNGIIKASLISDPRNTKGKYIDIRKKGLTVNAKRIACREFARSLSGDAVIRRLVEHRRYLESLAYLLHAATEAKELQLNELEVEYLLNESRKILRWLRSNSNAKFNEIEEKTRMLEDAIGLNVRCTLQELMYHALNFTNLDDDIQNLYLDVDSQEYDE